MSMKRNGVYEWIFQRISNLLIITYAGVYIYLINSMQTFDYNHWVAMHSANWFIWFTSFTLVVVMANSILAGWQIGTDYTQKVPIPGFKYVFHSFYIGVSCVLLIGGIYILWS